MVDELGQTASSVKVTNPSNKPSMDIVLLEIKTCASCTYLHLLIFGLAYITCAKVTKKTSGENEGNNHIFMGKKMHS